MFEITTFKTTFEMQLLEGETSGLENSLSDMNSMDIVLGFHVNLNPVILVAGMPISANIVVDHIIEATVVLVPG